MPEGHTVHRLARDHNRDFAGQLLQVTSPQGRFAAEAKKLNGRLLKTVEPHGKHFCYHWEGDRLLHIHLGLYGKFRSHKNPPPQPQGQVRIRVVGEKLSFDLNGPNTCELLTQKEWLHIQSRLGPDPLRKNADPQQAWQKIQSSRAPIGTLLLNQSIFAGVGNIYRSEVLYLLRIHPDRPGKSLTRQEFDGLWSKLVDLLKIGVRYNRIIIADPKDVGKPISKMSREESLLVYKKAYCGQCDSKIQSWTLGGRKAFACTKCQET